MPDSFSVPMRSTAPSGSPTRYTDPKQIDSLLKSSDPEAVISAGQSYQKFAAAYEKIAGELLSMRTDLHEAWDGKDAAAAQAQLREVWSAAATIHKAAGTFGAAVERHGSEYLAWYKNNKPPSKDLAEAQSWMTGANQRISQSWNSLPTDLSTTLPPGDHEWRSGPTAGTDSFGGGGGGGSSDRSSSSGGGSGSSGHSSVDYTMSPGDGGTGTQLAGFSPTGGGGNTYDPGSGIGLPSTNAPSGLNPSGGPLVPGGGFPGPGVIGPGGVPPGGVGSRGDGLGPGRRMPGAAAAEEVQAAESGAAAGSVAAGAGADRHERERTRRPWLVEDEDVWKNDVESTPPLIGAEGGVTEVAAPRDAPIELGSSGDDDAITDILEELDDLDDLERDEPKDTATEIAELRAKLARLERKASAERDAVASGDDDLQDLDWIAGDDE